MPKPAKDTTLATFTAPAAIIDMGDLKCSIKVSILPPPLSERQVPHSERLDLESRIAHHLAWLFAKHQQPDAKRG
jgi:hypothetical protein